MGRLLVSAAMVVVLAELGGDAGAGGSKAKVYKTPEAVFEAAIKSAEQSDFKTLVDCLTRDSRDTVTGGVVFVSLMMKAFGEKFGKDEDKANIKKLDELLAKHGLTEEYINSLPKPKLEAKQPDPDEQKKALKKLLAPVKDKSALLAELLALLPKKDKKDAPFGQFGSRPMLENLKIDGDVAKGEIVGTKDDKEVRKPIDFKKEDGSWRIEAPEMAKKK
jgi:hypothetical protein